jgi:putative nucleotidyltransferase with HDIG domain
MKEGATDYVLKPFQLDAVVASLERGLERKRLELEVENYRKKLEQMVDQRTRQLQAAIKRIELTYDETLEALAAALDLKDNETAGHSKRVTLFSLKIAKAMGCTDEQRKQIERGAYLHDIGKIGIPDAILLKPGKLSPREMEIMQEHVRIGYDLVCRISFLAPAAQIVLTHQERFDGTGYPQGLMGEEIPLGARIFTVADTLDAMTSDRPYRRALPYSAAREEIQRESGRQFDPAVVEVFLAIAEETWEGIRKKVLRASVSSTHVLSAFSGSLSRRSGGT